MIKKSLKKINFNIFMQIKFYIIMILFKTRLLKIYYNILIKIHAGFYYFL